MVPGDRPIEAFDLQTLLRQRDLVIAAPTYMDVEEREEGQQDEEDGRGEDCSPQ